MKKRYIFPSILSLSFIASLPASAQFDQSISVEGKYVPEVIRLDRINAFPRQEKFELETSPLSYDSNGVPACFGQSIYTLPAMGWRDSRLVSRQRGYLDFGMGSWLNSTLSAGYRFLQDETTSFGVRLQHNSTSLWQPNFPTHSSDNKMYRYDEAIGLYGSHLFEGKGRLEAAADYHLGIFDYYGYNPAFGPIDGYYSDQNFYKAPKQTLNDFSFRVDWRSLTSSDNISWNVGAGVRYFGYSDFYIPTLVPAPGAPLPVLGDLGKYKSTHETDINLRAGLNFPLSDKSAVGLDLNADALLYSGFKTEEPQFGGPNNIFMSTDGLLKPDSYFLASLTPYYRFAIDRLNIRIGVDIDIAANAGMPDNRYSAFHFAPDVMADYDGGGARLFLHLQGGSRLNTLASNAQLDYYQMPFVSNTRPVYSPLDGEFGVSFGPFSGFSAGLGFAFRVSKGEYTGGWYQAAINGTLYPGLITNLPISASNSQSIGDINYSKAIQGSYDLHGYSLRANIGYDLGKIFKISAHGSYQPQAGKKGYFNGLDRPRWVADITAETNPIDPLKLSLSYNYRGVRRAYIIGEYHTDRGFDESILTSRRLPDMTTLNFGASWSFSPTVALWLQVDNILNQHIEILPSLPAQGIAFAGSISLNF